MAGRSMRVALFFLALSALLCVLASPEESQREDGGRFTERVLRTAQRLGTTPSDKWEWTTRNIFAAALACLCALLANSAGIGGGPFYVPLLTVVLGFDLKAATGLSHTIVATSAVASSIYGLLQPHPTDPNRPLVDFDIALTFIPALLVGVSFGVLLNVLVPDWLQTALLTVLLLFVINKTVRKGITQWRQEQKALQQKRSQVALHDDDDDDDEEGVLHEECFERNPSKKFNERHSSMQQMQIKLSHVWHRLPFVKILEVVVLWGIFLATQQLKSLYSNCTWQFFLIFAVQVIFLAAVTAYCVWYEAREAAGPHADEMDPELRSILNSGGDAALGKRKTFKRLAGVVGVMAFTGKRKTFKRLAGVVGVMAFAGFTAGLLGIGGALIFNPVLLQLGVHPQVTASTSVLMILFTSSAIALSFYFQHLLNTSYALVLAPLCFIASLIGVTVVGRLIRKTGRVSIIVLLLSGLIIVGTVLTAVFGTMRTIENIKNGAPIGFKPFCE